MEIKQIPLSKLVPDKDNPRHEMDEINELADSLQEHGQEQPCTVEDLKDGRFLLDDGHRRYPAFKLLEKRIKKEPIIACIVKQSLSPEERLLKRCVIDAQRKNFTVQERDAAWKRLWDIHSKKKGFTKAGFAKLLGVPVNGVDNFVDRMQIGETFLKKLNISPAVLEETKHLKPEKRKKILKYISEKGLGGRPVRQMTKIVRDASDAIVEALVSDNLTMDQAKKLKHLSENKQKVAIDNIKATKKHMDKIPKLVDKKPEKEEDKGPVSAQEFIERLQEEVLNTSSQMAMIEGTLEEIDEKNLEQYFTPTMIEALKLSLEELNKNIKPAILRIEKVIKKWGG